MKKLLLLPLIAILSLSSCNDDEGEPTPPPPVSEVDADLRGNWTNTFQKRVYYSINDTVMYADSLSNLTDQFKFDGLRMTVTLPGSNTQDVWNYSFPDESNPNLIVLTKGGITNDWIIKSITDTLMVWEDEEEWAGFPVGVPDSEKTTSKKGVYTYEFVRDK